MLIFDPLTLNEYHMIKNKFFWVLVIAAHAKLLTIGGLYFEYVNTIKILS